jgi:glutaredoxin/glutathione-dependent peroxiredoxin
MTLSVGDRVPAANLFEPGESGPEKLTTDALFGGRKVVLVGMPGAFTPTCHRNHLPGFLENRDAMLSRGVDEIVVLTTNDTHVLKAWAETSGGKGKVRFVSDGNTEFIGQTGLSFDGSGTGMGTRARRFAMIVDNGVVTALAVEEKAGQTAVSTAAQILEKL